jgi:hypothetical protein
VGLAAVLIDLDPLGGLRHAVKIASGKAVTARLRLLPAAHQHYLPLRKVQSRS